MKKIFLAFLLIFQILYCFSESNVVDYNEYYRFPLSLGVEYQSLSPFAEYGAFYNIYDLSANVRWPIPSKPVFQPVLRLGIIKYDNQDLNDPVKWDHTGYYAQIGAFYAHRFQKNFEIGGELTGGILQTVYPNLVPEEGSVGSLDMVFEAGAMISLDPSYNMSIDIHPNLKYIYSPGYLKDFNGLVLGIGFSASYRFGEDPDAPAAVIRSLKFSRMDIPDLFAAMQSYYVDNPLGSVTITNTEEYEVRDLEISFYQAGFMDTPTPAASLPVLAAGESMDVPIYASFNREIFTVEGITPLTGEIIVSYTSGGKPAEQKISATYDLYDKTSMVWNDDRKVAAFITPADSALRNYSSFIRQSCKKDTVPSYCESMQFAVQVFNALGEIGCIYQVDPALPFTKVQEDRMVVDSINLPRNTLKNITGDCDDLTVLYCSLLETVGIDTGFITIPGHIYAAFNTKVPVKDYREIHPDRRMTLSINGELWVPVEITMIGKSGFPEAWRTGIEEWTRYENEPDERSFYNTRESQELYRPVGLRETDLGLQYGSGEAITLSFKSDMSKIISNVLNDYIAKAEKSGRKQDYNRLGIMYARFGQYREAEKAFEKVVALDPEYTGARINLGNLQFLKESYVDAVKSYKAVLNKLEEKGKGDSSTALKVLINLARSSYMLEEYDEVDKYYSKAKEIDAEKSKKYAYLAAAGSSDSRGAKEPDAAESIIFVEEE